MAASRDGNVHYVKPDETVDEAPDAQLPANSVATAMIDTARRRHGVAGAMLAGGMLAIDQALGLRPAKEEAPIIVASPTDPIDIDEDGIDVDIDDETWVYAPPQPASKVNAKATGIRR